MHESAFPGPLRTHTLWIAILAELIIGIIGTSVNKAEDHEDYTEI